ncbi:MAG: GyrI-like domain-containing protein [Levilactobacillus sp.]|jgi:predicted transcriptional regulator YdeE|uniref:GyrI-like domain-containing protein n=1 Tax=Levilactobacillus sp. TaxID=2767919 RepID=UPI0025908454|nr:GyrI-like domain-containing protein [Levilactobacillus sp.]MCI1553600.1 GyrI-like domain-containing protein [Levilactobacillus sp.]MCI1599486.1 GyrI-like domain-containing protein [Levilactobacillus sp.]MCI1605299.1 GyrI-like domain-containing protein [Levilactobacillus sp.]
MANYTIETKPAFTVLGIGTILTGDFPAMGQQKTDFWQRINAENALAQLDGLNDYPFAVNEAINGEFHYYAGREVASDTTPADGQRLINFPAGKYLVITGSAADQMGLYNTLEGPAFGEILPQLTDYAYVGGPNTSYVTGSDETGVHGEMLVPLVAK